MTFLAGRRRRLVRQCPIVNNGNIRFRLIRCQGGIIPDVFLNSAGRAVDGAARVQPEGLTFISPGHRPGERSRSASNQPCKGAIHAHGSRWCRALSGRTVLFRPRTLGVAQG